MLKHSIAAIPGSLIFFLFFASCVAAQGQSYTFEYNSPGAGDTVTGCTKCVGKAIIIPRVNGGTEVTTIGRGAFNGAKLTGATIPGSVVSIDTMGFFNNALTSITIPGSVTSIGIAAFQLNKLTSVILPDSVTSLGTAAFAQNDLTSVTISANITSIANFVFSDNKLTSVTIPAKVTSIGESAFAQNDLTSVTIPANVTSIGSQAFAQNDLTSVTIPASVTSIGSQAFGKNPLLTSVVFEGNRPTIETDAFEGSNIGTVTFRQGTNGWTGDKIAGVIPTSSGSVPSKPVVPPKTITPREATSVPTLPVALLMALPLFIASIVFKKRK